MSELMYEAESFKLRGACFEVYKDKGHGFLEAVFQECLAIEFGILGIPFVEQPTVKLTYKGHELKQGYIPDFVCYGKIIVELKAVKAILDEHRAQIINYLKATGMHLGLLVNFGAYPRVEIERFVFQEKSTTENTELR
ncbi:MAG TPA: GxxExxY protein [Kiritimatiellia bacterium]|nr:GxxExxY protein [Kiritimatiellia bacterium]HMO98675.1 GxxExxY protein [Kiritimatiellia bacterium]HMP90831.1 GxxExxY protein [Kiritimatiellia bacterium]